MTSLPSGVLTAALSLVLSANFPKMHFPLSASLIKILNSNGPNNSKTCIKEQQQKPNTKKQARFQDVYCCTYENNPHCTTESENALKKNTSLLPGLSEILRKECLLRACCQYFSKLILKGKLRYYIPTTEIIICSQFEASLQQQPSSEHLHCCFSLSCFVI